jgi:toxin-antitoxin system, toxin component, bro family
MSEKMAGIFAINVVNEKDYMEINGVKILKKEFNGEKVLTAWDIAKIHGREPREVNQNLKNLKEKMVEGEDYYSIPRTEIDKSNILIQEFIPNNVKNITLFNESGYLLISRTFDDEFSWKLQKFLIKNYFNMQKLMHSIQNGEIEVRKKEAPTEFEIKKLENESEMIRLEKAKLLERLANSITNKKMKNTLIIHSANTVTGQLLLEPEKAERRSYTAGEISEMLKERYNIEITVNMIGRIATKYNLKTEEYGYLAYDKSKTSVKQVETFRYFENAVPKFYEIIKEHYSVKYL